MSNLTNRSIKRPIVARDGGVYYVRRLHRSSKSVGVYLPKNFLEAVGWTDDDALMVWMQGETILIRRLEIDNRATKLIPIPPRGRRNDQVPPDEEA